MKAQQMIEAATESHKAKRRQIIAVIEKRGVKVPKPNFWKLEQLHMLEDVLQQLDRKYKAQLTVPKSSKETLAYWPPQETPVADKALVATRLLRLSELIGCPMADLLIEARELATQHKLETFETLGTLEYMNGYTWCRLTGAYVLQLEMRLDV
ncbi:hypothetical protein [Paenibacillus agilis]|uniref:Uncharacterized protein n=1 Tax=Paenibacillus agilis TaxID=3020863 RepID=A0A559IXC6_9BACL|nr:hypothetical protein [Paenibacillus agilis]TVX92269.1 hypothetical protein FPZ44_03840 [Paenibacillus agilis]